VWPRERARAYLHRRPTPATTSTHGGGRGGALGEHLLALPEQRLDFVGTSLGQRVFEQEQNADEAEQRWKADFPSAYPQHGGSALRRRALDEASSARKARAEDRRDLDGLL